MSQLLLLLAGLLGGVLPWLLPYIIKLRVTQAADTHTHTHTNSMLEPQPLATGKFARGYTGRPARGYSSTALPYTMKY